MFGANAQSSQGAQNSKKTVVCYFSATGTTARLAKTAASALDAALHEIVPAQKYSSADLNWRDNSSRCVKENNDEKSRPAIANSIDLSGYDNVIIAYPIWWGLAPKIVYTFVEQNDLNGKNNLCYIMRKEMPDSFGRLHCITKKAVQCGQTKGRLYFLTLLIFQVRKGFKN